jgi:hypothetical protein
MHIAFNLNDSGAVLAAGQAPADFDLLMPETVCLRHNYPGNVAQIDVVSLIRIVTSD